MNKITLVFFLIIGLLFGSLFNRLGNIVANKKDYKYNVCDNCKNKVGLFHVSFFSYILNLGRCNHCKRRLNLFPIVIEITTSALFAITYLRFYNEDPLILNLLYSILLVSSLIIIVVKDVKYLIIPDKILIVFAVILSIIKISMGIYNEEYTSILDVGYGIIFLLIDGYIMYYIMVGIKKLGDFILRKDSLGGGDIKLMFYISMILGWKMSIVVIFLAAFLALPYSIINMIKNDRMMFAFGPYLSIAALILFLSKIDFSALISYLI